MLLAIFEPGDELSALFRIAGIVIWILGAFPRGRSGQRLGGVTGAIALGLAVFFFPTMWQEADAAFGN